VSTSATKILSFISSFGSPRSKAVDSYDYLDIDTYKPEEDIQRTEEPSKILQGT
jgi:hypothetical protein